MDKQLLGQKGEEAAQAYLVQKGYRILERNFRLPQGELDIIAKKAGRIIFVEVKTIKQQNGFQAQDHINKAKRRKLLKLAELYLLSQGLDLGAAYQIDIIAVEMDIKGSLKVVDHFANALEDN